MYALRVGAWQQKIYICAKFLPYTKLIKIQLGKKFFSSVLAINIVKYAGRQGRLAGCHAPFLLERDSKAFAFAYASFLISWQSKVSGVGVFPMRFHLSFDCQSFCCVFELPSPPPTRLKVEGKKRRRGRKGEEREREEKTAQLKSKQSPTNYFCSYNN